MVVRQLAADCASASDDAGLALNPALRRDEYVRRCGQVVRSLWQKQKAAILLSRRIALADNFPPVVDPSR